MEKKFLRFWIVFSFRKIVQKLIEILSIYRVNISIFRANFRTRRSMDVQMRRGKKEITVSFRVELGVSKGGHVLAEKEIPDKPNSGVEKDGFSFVGHSAR